MADGGWRVENSMEWPCELRPATFVRRENRFRALLELDGELVAAHVPNSGRLGELFAPRAAVWIAPHEAGKRRKTACDLILVEYAGTLVSVDARLPNRLVAEALLAGRLSPFAGYDCVQPEVQVGRSRLDFLLAVSTSSENVAQPRCWMETKSVTLVENRIALFPDAPTERGVRHLEELIALRQAGDRAAVAFVVQRQDAGAFAPHPSADPAFAAMLRSAVRQGVEVYAWRCRVDHNAIALTDPLEIIL